MCAAVYEATLLLAFSAGLCVCLVPLSSGACLMWSDLCFMEESLWVAWRQARPWRTTALLEMGA